MYDVSQRSSFDCLADWLVEMRSHLPAPSNIDNIIFVVCANKVYSSIGTFFCPIFQIYVTSLALSCLALKPGSQSDVRFCVP